MGVTRRDQVGAPAGPASAGADVSPDLSRIARLNIGGYAAAIAGAEALFAFGAVAPAALLHAVLLLALLNHAALVFGRRGSQAIPALLALALIPLVRLASLGVATPGIAPLTANALVWLPIVAGALIGVFPRLPHRPVRRRGSWFWPVSADRPEPGDWNGGLGSREAKLLMERARRAARPRGRRRAMIVMASAGGMSAPAIARALECGETEVVDELARFDRQRPDWPMTEADPAIDAIRGLYRSPPADGGVVISFDDLGSVLPAGAAKGTKGRYLLCAYDVHNDELRAQVAASRTAASVLAFMRTIRLRYPLSVRIHWVQDGRPSLWAKGIRAWAAEHNVELVATPRRAGFLKRVTYPTFPVAELLRRPSESDWPSLSRLIADRITARNGRPALARIGRAPWRQRIVDVLGSPASWADEITLVFLGAPLGLWAYFAADPEPITGFGGAEAGLAVAILVAVIGEEIVFRGALLRALAPVAGLLAVPVAAGLYAAVYLSAPAPFLLYTAGLGLALTAFAARSGSVIGVIGAHAVASLGAFLIYPMLFA